MQLSHFSAILILLLSFLVTGAATVISLSLLFSLSFFSFFPFLFSLLFFLFFFFFLSRGRLACSSVVLAAVLLLAVLLRAQAVHWFLLVLR